MLKFKSQINRQYLAKWVQKYDRLML